VAVITVDACGATDPSASTPGGQPGSLSGTSWVVLSVAGRSPVPGAVPTLSFGADAVTGSGGCNHLGGSYRLDPATGGIALSDLGMTAMGCLQVGVGDYETTFLRALGSATKAGVDTAGQLRLEGPAGQIVLAALEHPAATG
jgi:heat shock protein HslJ